MPRLVTFLVMIATLLVMVAAQTKTNTTTCGGVTCGRCVCNCSGGSGGGGGGGGSLSNITSLLDLPQTLDSVVQLLNDLVSSLG